MVIDDNTSNYKSKYPKSKINFIQIDDTLCESSGFKNMNFTVNKLVTGWEKALYYFANSESDYNKIWFLEDDVFLYNELTLQMIDKQFPNSDLLTNVCSDYKKDTWNWSYVTINFDPPYYSAMVCATRLSKTLINLIKDYANQHKTLYFLEALFPTTCRRNNLVHDTPKELENVLYNIPPKLSELDKMYVYHPVKKISLHVDFRSVLDRSIHKHDV